MSTRQLLVMICVSTALALILAWIIEETQVRRFKTEFAEWWEEQNSGSKRKPQPPATD